MFTEQEKLIYSLLQTKSRRAIARERKRYGHPYKYRPKIDLCKRIARQTGLTVEQARDALIEISDKIKRSNGEVIL